jgi:integrase
MALPKVYQRGALWWVRLVYEGTERRCSTGSKQEEQAQNRVRLFYDCAKRDRFIPLLQAVAAGRIELHEFTTALQTDTVEALRRRASDVDLEPHVKRWLRELRTAGDLRPDTVDEYEHMVRSLIPPGVPFYASSITPKSIKDWLLSLRHQRTGAPVSTTTRRHYYDALRNFVRWARVEQLVPRDVLADIEVPKLAPPRRRLLEYDALRAALEAVPTGPCRAALFYMAGSGAEQQAAERATGRDVIRGQLVNGRALNAVWAHGSKNGFRSRLTFVREWAWAEVAEYAGNALPTARIFDAGAQWIRRQWKAAQLAAKVADQDSLLTVHDLRKCYCVMVTLGSDGEPRQDLQWCADQLGHGDTLMVSRIYGAFRLRDRLRAVEALDAQRIEQDAAPVLRLHSGGV